MKRKLLLILLTQVAIFFVASIVVYAQGKIPTDDEVNAIAKKLYCPVCPNTPLDVCETKACEDWRAQIRDELSAGWSEQQIIDYFVAQYGERVLAEPQRKGFTSLVWMLPVLAVLFGAVVVWQVLKNWRSVRQPPIPNPSPAPISPETLARIEKELREMK
jgi:cytochrome c-type biogenesis protein CcmH